MRRYEYPALWSMKLHMPNKNTPFGDKKQSGFSVRGTVRDSTKNAWIQARFDEKYGIGKHELVKVKGLSAEGAPDEAVKGSLRLWNTSRHLSLSPGPNIVVNNAIAFTMHALHAAAKEKPAKHFVLTSSAAAAN
ncbi:hypothetical protein B0A55_10504 [Friedmanniomyces simplex]|nr:hypothetical protein B0A55_10504 [Friedmanniomyces simplex]